MSHELEDYISLARLTTKEFSTVFALKTFDHVHCGLVLGIVAHSPRFLFQFMPWRLASEELPADCNWTILCPFDRSLIS
jgi:hypothetical protein